MNISHRRTAWFLVLVAVSCLCVPACGQTVKLLGQVVDGSGAPVPNARVLLIELNTLEIRRASSDDKGTFEFSGLTRTPYEVKAACPNFVTGSAKVFELVDSVGFSDPNADASLTVKVRIRLAVKSAS
jgi:protocatechuate 3,4-dioxygenase beta subunit